MSAEMFIRRIYASVLAVIGVLALKAVALLLGLIVCSGLIESIDFIAARNEELTNFFIELLVVVTTGSSLALAAALDHPLIIQGLICGVCFTSLFAIGWYIRRRRQFGVASTLTLLMSLVAVVVSIASYNFLYEATNKCLGKAVITSLLATGKLLELLTTCNNVAGSALLLVGLSGFFEVIWLVYLLVFPRLPW